MFFKSTRVLLSSLSIVLVSSVKEESVGRLGVPDQKSFINLHDDSTSYVRKLKKDKKNDEEVTVEDTEELVEEPSVNVAEEMNTQPGITIGDFARSNRISTFENLDDVDWNHGTASVSAEKSGTITFDIPNTTHIGDMIFLFLR